jgi:hypothetical protein
VVVFKAAPRMAAHGMYWWVWVQSGCQIQFKSQLKEAFLLDLGGGLPKVNTFCN